MNRFFEPLRLRDPIWQAVGTIIGIVALIVSTAVAYDIYRKSVQYTDVTVTKFVVFDPLRFSKAMEGRVALLVDGLTAESVLVYYYSISNTGQVSIRPNDYVKPIRISVQDPWALLAVETESTEPPDLQVAWTRVSTQTFEMEPVLLNPEDTIWALLFVTGSTETQHEELPEPQWTARIANVHSLDVRSPETPKEQSGLGIFWTGIKHYGWSLYWFAGLAVCLFVVGVLLSVRYGRLSKLSAAQVALLTAIMMLSFSSSEIMVDMLIEHDKQWWGAWFLLGLHVLLFGYLIWPIVEGRRGDVKR